MRDALDQRLPRPAEPGVRWVPPGQWHVTLRFLGALEPDDERAVTVALAQLVAPGATARLGPRVSRLGRTAVCLPVAGLDPLAGAVRAATAGVGDPPERPFAGHLTLARLRNRAACGLTGTPVDLSFEVTEVVLVRSTLGTGPAGGAVHEPVLSVPLS